MSASRVDQTTEPSPTPGDLTVTEARTEVELSVVMPCLNEEKTIGSCIRKARGAMNRLGVNGEIVIADNGSTDDSVATARSLGARVIHERRKGYGSALMAGCAAARGRFILMGDADDSYDFEQIDGFVERLRSGYELVMGTRLRGTILPGAMPWKNRYIGNPALTSVLRRLFRAKITDAHCGMRAFTKAAYEEMDLRTPGMEFASEMLIKAAKLRLKITEVPIVFHPDRRGRAPHLRPWRDGLRHVKLMLIFSPTALFLVPGLVLLAVGFGLMVSQLFAPIDQPLRLLGFRLDFHWAILGGVLAVVGYQIVTVSFFARVYSVTHRLREDDKLLERALRVLTLGRVLAIASLVILTGTVIDAVVAFRWLRSDFGTLLSGYTRFFIFGSTLLALGLQTFFNAFFFSILGDAYRYDRSHLRAHGSVEESVEPSPGRVSSALDS
jgi:hypothetical protein